MEALGDELGVEPPAKPPVKFRSAEGAAPAWIDWRVGGSFAAFRDDMGPIADLAGDYLAPWDYISQDSFSTAWPQQLAAPIDADAYPWSVGTVTVRFIAYHGAVPTLPSGGWTLGLRLGGGTGWHVS